MTIEYIGKGLYRGTMRHENGTSIQTGSNRADIINSMIKERCEYVGIS